MKRWVVLKILGCTRQLVYGATRQLAVAFESEAHPRGYMVE
jgi:hypothetical protein